MRKEIKRERKGGREGRGEGKESSGGDNKEGEVVKVTTMNPKSCGIGITIIS